jgi:hypothetical protein
MYRAMSRAAHRIALTGLTFFIITVTNAAFAQPEPFSRSPQQGEQKRVEIKGTVINAATHEPIRHALVNLSGVASRSMFTDDNGSFAFSNVISGYLVIQAQRPGFSMERPKMLDTTKSLEYEIKLMPFSVVYGRITGAHDEPLERANVQVLKAQVSNGRRNWSQVGGAATDEDGNFRVASLQPGAYKISAGPVRASDLGSLNSAYPIKYYPDAPDRDSASPIQLQPGQQMELNFKLAPAVSYAVSGSIVGASSAMGASIEFLDTTGMALNFPYRFDPDTGSFEVRNVPAGRYTIRTTAFGEARIPFRGRTPVNVNSNVTGVTLTLGPPTSIPVTYRTLFTKQTPPRQNELVPGMAAQVQLISTAVENSNYYVQPEGRPEDHVFSIQNVEPGTYEVEVTSAGPWYVASVQSGSRDLLHDTLIVPPSGKVEPIEITLRDDPATLQGTVRGAETPGELLVVSDTDPSRRVRGNYSSGSDFYVPSLAPGSYSVYAFDHLDKIEYANPDVLREYRSRAARVTLSPNQTSKVTVEVIGTEQ